MTSGNPMTPANMSVSDVSLPPRQNAFSANARGLFNRFSTSLRCGLADGSLFFAIVTIAVWLLSRSFQGIEGDARVYMARALADLDPNGVGRDFMFVYDGQSQFSIFTFLADRLVGALNPANASIVFWLSNCICWFAAALFFVSRFTQSRMTWAILIVVAALPSYYGPFELLRFGEQYAIPRPLTEACVLAVLGFLIDGRRGFALLFLALAAVLHPIMALPGALIFGVDLCRSDRRWIWLGGAFGLAAIAAAACHLPLFDRLTTLVDPEWLTLLRIRNPYLFPTVWPAEPFGLLALEIATIAIATEHLAPRVRFIFLASAGAGLFGMICATLFADLWPLLLVVQAQLWRMIWLTGVVAAVSLALCLLNLRSRSPRFELACAFLVFGWFFTDEAVMTFLSTFAALLIYYLRQLTLALSRRVLNSIWILLLLFGGGAELYTAHSFVSFWMNEPEGGRAPLYLLWNTHVFLIPIVLLAMGWAWRSDWLSAQRLGPLAGATALCAVLFWDDRADARKINDAAHRDEALAKLFPADQSEIYWVGGMEPWYLVGHPSWLLRIQGAGIVFSRPLAVFWQERLMALIELDLADKNILTPWSIPMRQDAIPLKRDAVDRLCARHDAPSAIVAPLEDGMTPAADLKFKTWRPPAPEFRLTQQDAAVTWHRVSSYMIVSCADHVPDRQTSSR
jgi:hypothetical protein